jgi:DNA-binding MarR family transcriptional regulator
MNRNELIKQFSTSMGAMARIGAMHHKPDELPKGMPPHGQLGLLFMVSHKGAQTIKELSGCFGMTSSAATQLVNGLVTSGLLTRQEDKSDRRVSRVVLTAKGNKVLAQAKQYRMKKMTEMFAPLNEKELAQLLKLQTKIVEHWESIAKKSK